MQIKTIAMMVVAGCAIGLSTGCIKQKDVDAMMAAKDAERAKSEAALNTTIAEKQSLYDAEQAKTRQLQNQLREASVELTELKDSSKDLKSKLDDANSKIDRLESSLESTKRQVQSAKDRADAAEGSLAAAQMETQETKRRFDMLRKALLDLNGKKPADLGIDLSTGLDTSMDSSDMGGMSSADMGSMGSADTSGTDESSSSDEGSSDLESLLDDMGNM